MGDAAPRPAADRPLLDPATTPLHRRRVLLLMGAGALAAGGGLGVLLEACSAAPIPVELAIDPSTLVPGTPTEVPFTLTSGGSSVEGSTWLVRKVSGEIVAFDSRCTHAQCAYAWVADANRFNCNCHGGAFALDGTVLAGPPPRPLDRFPLTVTGDRLEIEVPAGFATPHESLGG
jgi:Rieske Fe-S protein